MKLGMSTLLLYMGKWIELESKFKKNETIDESVQRQISREEEHWKQVFLRILAVVKTVAKNNLAFCGDDEEICGERSRHFLSFIEMIAKLDPVMQHYIQRIERNEAHYHYLRHTIQNELIQMLAIEIKSRIVQTIKEAKYFSVMLDCTPDMSDEEQISLVIRCVDVSSSPIKVEEFFIEFLKVYDASGLGLFNVLKEVLCKLQLDIGDIRGQGYDNGFDMKEKYKGVHKRLLEINPRAFHTPCGCRSLNLALCDMALTCSKACSFFGMVQRIYSLFSSCTKWWKVLKDNVEGFTLEPLAQTRWESSIESVKAIRYQAPQIRDALIDLANISEDPKTKCEAECLATHEIENFEFLVGMVIWHNLLFAINLVSKTFENEDMHIDVAINQLKGLITFLERYREIGFLEAVIEAKEVATAMDIEPVFHEQLVIRRKKRFDENVSEEVTQSAEESFRINYFTYIVDRAISSLKSMIEQFQTYEETFGFLFDLIKLNSTSDECLKTYCANLEDFLTHEKFPDIDGRDLFTELKVLTEILPKEIIKPIEVANYLKVMDGCFPNAWIVYRILLAIPVTIASRERSFSKLKLIRSYIPSTMSQETMSQERLNELAMLSIENDMVDKLDCARLISSFASKNARRVIFS
ncbi:uncharacterized protein LOC114270161 [Camellia sinensis]|uniref:uncharacterized protein LOC114270161 n=1 Tax=Camellia sinensis TaxID=4442 RepID=UPI001035D673|nr:uncharacterized protein LOC114270161 [Camellia sinensis]